ncbi:MAG: XdhC family protein, partial [Alphaproteobacteria bacterium]|nr:XdhC family protein [Alphaproteobacteria bacterium]
MQQAILDAILAARAAKRPVATVTHLESGDQALVYRDDTASGKIGALTLDAAAVASARRAIADDKSTRIDSDAGALFIQVSNPPKRMIIVGAVHIAQPLVEIAQTAGYALTIVDPRGAFATRDRFPDVDL